MLNQQFVNGAFDSDNEDDHGELREFPRIVVKLRRGLYLDHLLNPGGGGLIVSKCEFDEFYLGSLRGVESGKRDTQYTKAMALKSMPCTW